MSVNRDTVLNRTMAKLEEGIEGEERGGSLLEKKLSSRVKKKRGVRGS